ncbi:Low-density lipoprotein receptor-related protein 6, partial [Exaiptasia diaphana]
MLRHTFGISLFENTLYWSDWIKKGIFSASKFGGRKEDIQVHREGLQYVYCVEVYSSRRQIGANLCKQNNGGCEQLCLMKNSNSRRCACSMGFSLGKDQTSCDAINNFLLYATSKAIYGTSIDFKDSTSAMNPIAGMSNINSIDFFYNSSWIFYSDDRKRNIGRVNRDGTRKMIIISTGLRRPQGIAVDWVGMNLYWTDSGTDLIEVSRLNGSSRHVIISSGLSEPRSIVVHPGRGLLYWSDWSPPRIERSSMDGSFRQVLVWGSKIRRPSGLTIDYDQDIVYWVDLRRDSIWNMDLNGGNQKKLVSRLKQPLGLSVFGELLYWADRNKNIIQSAYKTNGTNIKQKTLLTKPRDVQVFSSERQSTGGVCEANGGCADLCLAISSKRKRCACSLGSLSSDKRSCLSTSNFIILAKTTEIKFNSLVPGKTSSQKEITDVTPVMRRQLDFDFDSETIFFTSPPAIKAVKIDGSGLRNVTLDVINPGGIAVDWVAKHVYWTEIAFSTINRVHFNGSSFKVALKQGINHPRALAIIPCEKKIYWIEWGRRPCIKSAWFNGMFVSDLITGSLVYPYGLTIDYMEEKIYWTDERIIQSAYLNGTNRQTITSSIRPALALTVFGEFIYWIDWHSTVMRANKYNGGNPVRMSYEVASGLPLDINVYAKERQD